MVKDSKSIFNLNKCKISTEKAVVQNILEINFGKNKVRHTEKGYKVTVQELQETEIRAVNRIIPLAEETFIKRSGTGLVVVVVLKPHDRA